MNLAELAERDLRERGERSWLWFEERVYTNREMHEASRRLARLLVRLGVTRGDRVIVTMENCPEVFVSFPAIWRVGAVAVPVLHVLDASELAYIVKDSKAKVLLTSADLVPRAEDAIARAGGAAPTIVAVTEGKSRVAPPVLSFEDELAATEPLDTMQPAEDDDLAVVLYTSGTTGRPKGVMQTHRNLIANAEHAWSTGVTKNPEELRLLALPLAHSFGLSALIDGYLFGPKAVLMRKFAPDEALHLIARHRIARMSGVPTMFVYMMRTPGEFDTSSVYMWIVGAAPMPPDQIEQFEQRFGGRMFVGYGLTEASPSVAVERENQPRKRGSTGPALDGVRLQIVDDAGKPLKAGEVGEICAQGENISLGYLGMPEATAESFHDGWFYTGDLGYLDEDGYLFIVDRKKDLIIRGGLNIYPKDVEEVLMSHPEVRECAVIGTPDAALGEQVAACVVREPGASVTAEALIKHTQKHLAKYKTPSYVLFLDELPKNTLGKILKKDLRKQVEAKLKDAPASGRSHG